jgi:superfamily II DNA or RNA helicase
MDNKKQTLYPNSNDINISDNIKDRFEFDIPVIKEKNSCDSADFKLAPYQIFLKNYICNDTPYNSILIYHGTGTGKTCSAIGIAENFRDIYQLPENRIIILSPDKIKQGWYNNIYDPKKLNDQCTSDTYKNLINDEGDIDKNRNKLVKKYYEFYGYLEFANRIKFIYEKYKDKFDYICDKKYSNRVLIIDEAHNIRGDDSESSDDTIKYLKLLIENTRNLKLILLTATPMYNKANEIVELLTLLYANDKRDYSKIKDVFKDDILIKDIELSRYCKGYISFIKGESEDKFPERLYPNINIINIGELPIYKCDMEPIQSKIYNMIKDSFKVEVLKLEHEKILTQCSNIVYPNNSNKIEKYYGKYGLKTICDYSSSKKMYKYKNGVEQIFDMKNIGKYSCKIKKLLETIENSEGIVFVYSQYIQSGVIPIMLALEQNGYNNYNKNIFDIKSDKYKGNYISITSDNDLSGNYKELLKICTSYENRNGEKIKIIIGSNVASEGLDLKNIRSIHVIDPWYHLKRLEQIIGRGIRYCSHKDLLQEQNDTTVYLYSSINKNSIDLDIYRLAEKKNKEIVKVEKILQENSIDSDLFKNINEPKPSKKDERCKYTIKKSITKSSNMNSLNGNKIMNMYNIYEIYIKRYFEKNISGNIQNIIDYICNTTITNDINLELLYMTLKYMINYKRIIIYNGNNGYLIYRNGEYIYQPSDKSDKNINIYERNSEQTENKYTKLTYKKIKNQDVIVIDIEDILKYMDDTKTKMLKKYKYIKNINGYNDVIYDYIIERLSFLEKRILIEHMLDDKLDIDMKQIVYKHFKSILIDTDYKSNTDKEKIGFVLFEYNNKKGLKVNERDIPKFFIKDDTGYRESKILMDRAKSILDFKDKVYPNYYNYVYVSIKNKKINMINRTNVYDVNKRKYISIMCPTANQTKNTLKDFKENLEQLYEKYSDILDDYKDNDKKNSKIKNDEFCIIIELIGRIEKDYNIQYNYDEYMLQTYKF